MAKADAARDTGGIGSILPLLFAYIDSLDWWASSFMCGKSVIY